MEIEFVIAVPPGTTGAELERIEHLRRAYARNRVRIGPAESAQAYWCGRFGVARQADWPAAPFRLDAQTAAAHYWLCADPLHLQFDRDRLLIDPQALDDLDMPQANALVAMLNAHYAADDIEFRAISPREWLLRAPRALDLAVSDPAQAAGLPAAQALPRGADAAWARRLSSEIQMLLHQADTNTLREAHRQWPVNSLWLWGGGTWDGGVAVAQRDVHLWSGAEHVRGWAEAAGAQSAPRPGRWPAIWPGEAFGGTNKLLIDLTEIALDRDWATHLQNNWIGPAALVPKTHNLTFSLTLLMHGASVQTRLYRSDLFHFFCRKSLAKYVDNIQNQADS
jgi:hypothetical protein